MDRNVFNVFEEPVVGTAKNPTIIDASDCRYLGQVLRLPKYSEFKGILPTGVLDKSLADAGGSYVAMNCNDNCIVVVPTRALRKSLVDDSNNQKECFNFESIKSSKGLIEYLHKDGYKKIVCVYNSLPRVVEILKQENMSLNKFKVVVDEYQVILTAADFRQEAMNDLFDCLREFDYVTYLSATPIKEEYEIEELKHLPHYKIKWNRTIKVNLINREFESDKQQCNYICNTIKDMLEGRLFEWSDRKQEEKVETIHIFCNSVKTIGKICETLQLLPNQVRICRSNSFQGRIPNYIADWEIESPYGWVKKPVNFYTCCAYEGCNIYCNNGLVFVYSDGGREYMQTDISTDMVQIAGRIRESKTSHNIFRSKIIHCFNKHYEIFTEEDLKRMIDEYDKNTDTILNMQEKLSEDEIKLFAKKYKTEGSFCQLNKEKDRLIRSDLKKKNALYKNNLKFQYMKDGILQFNGEFDEVVKEDCQHNVLLTKEVYETTSFVMALKKIFDLCDNQRYPYFCRYPELKDITLYLSRERVHSLGYNRRLCVQEVELIKVMEGIILSNLKSGFYTSKQLNSLFKKWNSDPIILHQIENFYIDNNKCSSYVISSKKWLSVISTLPTVITKKYIKKIRGKSTRLHHIIVNSFNTVDDVKMSIALTSGKYETKMITTNWNKILLKESKSKDDSYLISEGYSDSELYSRNYSSQSKDSFRYVDSIILDIDDGITIEEFTEQYKEYDFLLYTTWSHTNDHHKFRVIIPLSETIEIYGKCNLFVKAKRRLFPKQDMDCSLCYFAPSSSSKIQKNEGKRYNSKIIYDTMLRIEGEEKIKDEYSELLRFNHKPLSNENGKKKYWDKCVETINDCPSGERNITIFKCVSQLKKSFGSDDRWIGYVSSNIFDLEKKKMFAEITKRHK